jgi:regulator of replication initiation timing
MQQQLTTEPKTAAEAVAARSCDDKACDEPAAFAYTWDWGGGGVCCPKHQFLHQQTAETLLRKVNFAPLLPPGPVALTRDERVKLKAEVYALEAEAEDLKSRGAELYRENTALTRQVQATSTRLRETELQLKEQSALVDELRWKLEKRDAEQGTLVDEVTRLRTLAKFSEPAKGAAAPSSITTTHTEETTVIDGPSGTASSHGLGATGGAGAQKQGQHKPKT